RNPGAITIRVQFHVITRGPAVSDGNIPISALDEQIDALNRAYSGQLGAGAANTPFRFTRAGVTVTQNAGWFAMGRGGSAQELAAKRELQVEAAQTLNFYTALPDPLGWATYPWEYDSDPMMDGVVVRFNTLPGVSGGNPRFNRGYTGVHEVGH